MASQNMLHRDQKIPALTIKQPWADFIVHGVMTARGLQYKRIENRDWNTVFRGWMAVHTSRRTAKMEWRIAKLFVRDTFGFPPAEERMQVSGDESADVLQMGRVIGLAKISGVVTESEDPWFFGSHGFVIEDAIALERPVKARGTLGFWKWRPPDDVLQLYTGLIIREHGKTEGAARRAHEMREQRAVANRMATAVLNNMERLGV